jgi:hypothetical protein
MVKRIEFILVFADFFPVFGSPPECAACSTLPAFCLCNTDCMTVASCLNGYSNDGEATHFFASSWAYLFPLCFVQDRPAPVVLEERIPSLAEGPIVCEEQPRVHFA